MAICHQAPQFHLVVGQKLCASAKSLQFHSGAPTNLIALQMQEDMEEFNRQHDLIISLVPIVIVIQVNRHELKSQECE